jgi:hypothetical protein
MKIPFQGIVSHDCIGRKRLNISAYSGLLDLLSSDTSVFGPNSCSLCVIAKHLPLMHAKFAAGWLASFQVITNY